MANPHSPTFRRGLASIVAGDILIAPLKAYLASPDFKGFDIKVRGLGERKPDVWFHPSEHPDWPEMALWLWMTSPDALIYEPQGPERTLAMTIGNIWHAIIGRSLLDMHLLEAIEVYVSDVTTKSRGSMDGVLSQHEIFELKTMKDMILRTITSAEVYIEKYPGYYLQAQEYMRMSGARNERVLLMSLTYPYDMREFVIPYNPAVADATAAKYRRVLQAVEDKKPPMCLGCWKNKKSTCPARGMCEHLARNS